MSFTITNYNNTNNTIKIMLRYDTDSFVSSIKTTDLLKNLGCFKDDFDFSELDKSHQLYDATNIKFLREIENRKNHPLLE